jgi:hypothetical protein
MLEDMLEMDEYNNRKRKAERNKPPRNWMGFDELNNQDIEKPIKQKRIQYDDYEDEYKEYLPRDPKRALKHERRKDKWGVKEWDY